jgi:hypothetical protein
MNPVPPALAESVLRVALGPREFDSVAGDLLEEYRDTIYPNRGQGGADWWYAVQVGTFVWRRARIWAFLFGGAFLARTALDAFAPTTDFSTRSTVSTLLGIAILLAAGCWAALRSGSFLAGTIVGLATTALGAIVSIVGASVLLGVWHDAATMEAIRGSGGVGEIFGLPVMLVMPGIIVGTVGGLVGSAIRSLQSA